MKIKIRRFSEQNDKGWSIYIDIPIAKQKTVFCLDVSSCLKYIDPHVFNANINPIRDSSAEAIAEFLYYDIIRADYEYLLTIRPNHNIEYHQYVMNVLSIYLDE